MKKTLFFLFVLNTIYLAQNSNLNKGIILFNSDPVGAQVCVNDSICGVTPLEVYNWKSGTYNFKFIKDTLEVNKYNISYNEGDYREIFAVLHSDYALLSVNSVPDGATVYLDGDSLGITPLVKYKIPVATHILEIKKEDYLSWNTRFIARPNLYEYAQKLDFGKGIIKIDNNGYKYYLDDKKIEKLSQNLKLDIGSHKIKIAGKNLHKDFVEEFELEPYQVKEIKFAYGYKSYNPLLYSIFLPGLGQIIDNSILEGSAIMATNLIFSGLSIISNQKYSKELDTYKNTVNEYKSLGTSNEFKVIELSNRMDETYRTAKDAQKNRNIVLGALIIAYTYNLIDAYLFHSIDGEITIINQATPTNSFENNLSLKLKLGL